MAGVAEKARFYLERAVPQLQDFEEKEIFSKDEIRTLVQKRTEYEHAVLSPGSQPSDFLAYASWEQHLESLRARRCRRLRVKGHHSAGTTSRAGQARTLAVFERGVARHPASVPLWRAYLDYAAAVGASRRWRKVVTRALRMHPREGLLWVLAGRRAARNGDMEAARGLFMRGCRFCVSGDGAVAVWVEYARCEMEWLARVERKKGAGKKGSPGSVVRAVEDEVKTAETTEEGDEIRFDDDDDDEQDLGEGGLLVMVPDPDAPAKREKQKVFSEDSVQKLDRTPALDGAIPIAIFDISRKQAFFDAGVAEAFFDMLLTFTNVSSQLRIVRHVLDSMMDLYPTDPSTCSCLVREPLIGVDLHTAGFPAALRESLVRLKASLEKVDSKEVLAAKTIAWIDPFLAAEDLDSGIKRVLEHTKRKLETP